MAELRNLQEFCEYISELLSAPITIEDVNHRLLAYSAHENYTDSARIATIIGRKVPETVINRLWNEGILPRLFESDLPITIPTITDVGLGKRIAISIRNHNDVLGFIWALETGTSFEEKHFAILKDAAATAQELILSLRYNTSDQKKEYKDLLWQLLTRNDLSHAKINDAFSTLGLKIPALYTVLVFSFEQPITPELEKHISYIIKTTEQIKPFLYTIDKNHSIMLASPADKQFDDNAFIAFIQNFAQKMYERYRITDVQGAYGNIRRQIKDIKECYQEALTTLSIKKRLPQDSQTIFNYRDLGILEYMDICSNYLPKKENPVLQKLTAYDAKHDTELVRTLEHYLDYDSNPKITAEHLHIHVNTLVYRLKRIAEISSLDLYDPRQKIKVYIDLKLQTYRSCDLL